MVVVVVISRSSLVVAPVKSTNSAGGAAEMGKHTRRSDCHLRMYIPEEPQQLLVSFGGGPFYFACPSS